MPPIDSRYIPVRSLLFFDFQSLAPAPPAKLSLENVITHYFSAAG
jgi:hypothetical protein